MIKTVCSLMLTCERKRGFQIVYQGRISRRCWDTHVRPRVGALSNVNGLTITNSLANHIGDLHRDLTSGTSSLAPNKCRANDRGINFSRDPGVVNLEINPAVRSTVWNGGDHLGLRVVVERYVDVFAHWLRFDDLRAAKVDQLAQLAILLLSLFQAPVDGLGQLQIVTGSCLDSEIILLCDLLD
jgi:hypothetical protein